MWRSNGELTSDVLQWAPTHGHASVADQQEHQLSKDTVCKLEELLGVMDDRDGWREREREREREVGIRAGSMT